MRHTNWYDVVLYSDRFNRRSDTTEMIGGRTRLRLIRLESTAFEDSMGRTERLARVFAIAERLQSGRHFNARQLADFCGVSHRTMFRDLRDLQRAGISIQWNPTIRGHVLANATRLPPRDVTIEEVTALSALVDAASGIQGIPFLECASRGLSKLLAKHPNPASQNIALYKRLIIGFVASRDQETAREHFEHLRQGILTSTKVRVRYRCPQQHLPVQTLLSPYCLLFDMDHWTVVGRSSYHRSTRKLPLSMILHSEGTSDDFQMPPRFLERAADDATRPQSLNRHRL